MIEKTILRLLSLKSYSTYELKRKLLSKGYDSPEIEKTLPKFKNFLNDEELSERLSESYKKRGYGPQKIAIKLHMKGLKKGSFTSDEQKSAIQKLLSTPAFQRKDRPKKIAALERRGFDLDVIFEVVT